MGLFSFVLAIKALFTGKKVQRNIQPLQERVERLESAVKTLSTKVNKLEEKVGSLVNSRKSAR